MAWHDNSLCDNEENHFFGMWITKGGAENFSFSPWNTISDIGCCG